MKLIFLAVVALWTAPFVFTKAEAGAIQATKSGDLGGELGQALIFKPKHTKPIAILICLHGIQSNRDWWIPLGEELASQGIAVWAFNRPGSGNPAPAGPARNSREKWDEQMDRVRRAALAVHGKIPVFAVGVSWGASPAMVAVQSKPDDWNGAILLNPAFKTTKDGDFKRATFAGLWPHRWFSPITLPLEAKDYTTRESTICKYLQPALIKETATFSFIVRTNGVKKKAIKSLPQTSRPVLVLLGTRDPLVTPCLFYQACPEVKVRNRLVTVIEAPATHAAIVEPERFMVARQISSWIKRKL